MAGYLMLICPRCLAQVAEVHGDRCEQCWQDVYDEEAANELAANAERYAGDDWWD